MKFQGIHSIAVNTLNLAGARFLTLVIRAVYIFIVAEHLGPALYGLYVYGTNWYLAFAPLAILGLQPVLGRMIGREREQVGAIASAGLAIRLVTTLVATTACIIVAWLVETDSTVRWVLAIFGIALFGRGFAIFANSTFVAIESAKYALRLDGTFRGLELLMGTLILLAGGGLLHLVALHAVIFWGQAVVGFLVMRRVIGGVGFNCSLSRVKQMVTAAIPLAVGALLINWQLQGPIILFRAVEGTAELLGQVGLAFQAFGVMAGIPGALAAAALPVLSRSIARGDGKEQIFADVSIRVMLVGGTCVAYLAIGIGMPLLKLILGTTYHDAVPYIGWTFWLAIPWAVAHIGSQIAVAQNRLKAYTVVVAVGAAVGTTAIPLLTIHMGVPGVFLGAGSGLVVWAVVTLLDLARRDGLSLERCLVRPVAASGFSFLAFLGLSAVDERMAFVAGLAVLAVVAWIFDVFSREERLAVQSYISGRFKR